MSAVRLEDFGFLSSTDVTDDPDGALQDLKLEQFEKGYSAGWEDAIKAQSENASHATDIFAKSLSDLSFTYQEAVAHMADALVPVLTEMVQKVVPRAAELGLNARLAEHLKDIITRHAGIDIVVICNPFRSAYLSELITGDFSMPVRLQEDDQLGRDCLRIRFGHQEDQLDLSEIVKEIESAVNTVTFQIRERLGNG
jgi:flagellar assembly protein FliH